MTYVDTLNQTLNRIIEGAWRINIEKNIIQKGLKGELKKQLKKQLNKELKKEQKNELNKKLNQAMTQREEEIKKQAIEKFDELSKKQGGLQKVLEQYSNQKPEGNFAIAYAEINGKTIIYFANSGKTDDGIIEEFNRYKEVYSRFDAILCQNYIDFKGADDLKKLELPIKRRNQGKTKSYSIEADLEKLEEKFQSTNSPIEKILIKDMLGYIKKRCNCTERKILEQILKDFKDTNINKGKIDLYTQLSPCHECGILIEEFNPKVTINVSSFSQLL